MGLQDIFRRKDRMNPQTEQKVDVSPGETAKPEGSRERQKEDFAVSFTPYYISDAGKIRYTVEHQLIRDHFFRSPASLIDILTHSGFYELASVFTKKMSWINPYYSDGIHMTKARINSDINILTIELSKPEYTPLCYRIHLCYSNQFTHLGYYTVECSFDGRAMLCGWDQDETHFNYGEIQPAIWLEETRKIMWAKEAHTIITQHAKNNNLNSKPEPS